MDSSIVSARWRRCALSCNTRFLGPLRVYNADGISDGLAVFCTAHRRPSLIYYTTGRPFRRRNCPFPWDIWTSI